MKHIVVIGAGLAGTLLSNELVKKCNVTLLEVGEKDSVGYPKIDFTHKPFAAVKTFCLGGGGTTNLWHNGLIPILPQDVTSSDFRTVLAEAEAYHDKAAANLYWKDNPYSVEYNREVSETNLLAQKIGVFLNGIDCLFYPKKFCRLVPVDKVNCFYSVHDIEFNHSDKRITSISYWAEKKKYSVDADVVIISAGALGSPFLVKKVLNALGCPSEKVGSGLIDHPLGFIGKVKVKQSINNIIKRFSLWEKGNYEYRTAIRIKSDCGKYTGCVFFRPAFTMKNELSIYKYKSLLGASSGRDRIRNMFSWKLFHPDIMAEIYSHLLGVNIPGRVYNILFLFEQKRGRNYVSYDDAGLVVDWSITDQEIKIYRGMIKKIYSMLEEIADEINIEPRITDDWLWSAAHHSGTISMGTNNDDVLDTDLKLKACDNVFVCDGSVIQEHSYANTGLTIGSLSMRLADKLLHA